MKAKYIEEQVEKFYKAGLIQPSVSSDIVVDYYYFYYYYYFLWSMSNKSNMFRIRKLSFFITLFNFL